MDPFGPPRKKFRPEAFVNGNGGIPGDLGARRFNPPDSAIFGETNRFKQASSLASLTETESLPTGLGSKSKACTKFFSTSGCPFGEGCHFNHFVPGGVSSVPQVPNLGTAVGTASRKPAGSTAGFLPSDQSIGAQAYKTRICNRYGTAEGCRFGEKCHFAHGEKELKKGIAPAHDVERERLVASFGSRAAPDGRPGGRSVYREPTPPGMAAAASFGASATAKISVDASLAGAIIGKGGVNSKQICRLTGAKLAIREHESDTNLKNIELEGTFDQIKQASAMVRELIMHTNTAPAKSLGFVSNNYKTKLCENYSQGTCTFGDRCHFAHGASELR